MLSTGLRLALPIIAVLMMVDISLALIGRVNAQLQLMTIAFPVKMMVGLSMLGLADAGDANLLRGTFAGTLAPPRLYSVIKSLWRTRVKRPNSQHSSA